MGLWSSWIKLLSDPKNAKEENELLNICDKAIGYGNYEFIRFRYPASVLNPEDKEHWAFMIKPKGKSSINYSKLSDNEARLLRRQIDHPPIGRNNNSIYKEIIRH